MRKLLVLLAAVAATVVAQAQVFPSGMFPPLYQDGFDALPMGSYLGFGMFGGNGAASRIGGANALLVSNIGGVALSPPNYMFGRGTDVQIRVNQPMTYFGGYFRLAPAGVTITQIKFAFYDQMGGFIGSQVVACPAGWTWIGWKTIPQWSRVEIYGLGGSLPGYVAMDDIRVRP